MIHGKFARLIGGRIGWNTARRGIHGGQYRFNATPFQLFVTITFWSEKNMHRLL